MKVIIFGTGTLYRHNREWIPMDDVLAFIDNDINKQGCFLDEKQIYAPEHILHLSFDKIVLMSANIHEMEKQLLSMGVLKDLIWTWSHYKSELLRGNLKLFCYYDYKTNNKKRILVLSTHLDYNGGTIAAVYAVQTLQSKGYQVILAAPSGNHQFIDEVVKTGINIVLCPSICFLSQVEVFWINKFDVILVNVFQMLPCACEISKFKPVLWWIHEPSNSYSYIYDKTREEFSQYDFAEMRRINIAAVSEIAKRNFEVFYPQSVNHVLPYGIPDEYVRSKIYHFENKLIFAIIGSIIEVKAQKLFLEAILDLSADEREQIEILVIGAENSSKYCEEVKELADQIPQVRMLGRLTRAEMQAIYSKIDVIVCASLEETMSIVITEGMMYGKVCITTDATGMADYIVNGVNGFICESGNVNSLCSSMKCVISQKDKLQNIKKNARKTYEENFTMDKFGERLENLVLETEKRYLNGDL